MNASIARLKGEGESHVRSIEPILFRNRVSMMIVSHDVFNVGPLEALSSIFTTPVMLETEYIRVRRDRCQAAFK